MCADGGKRSIFTENGMMMWEPGQGTCTLKIGKRDVHEKMKDFIV